MRTRIWLPEANPVIKLPTVGLHGYFTVDLIHAETGVVKQHLEFPNLLTDGLMNRLGDNTLTLANAFQFLDVGTGSAPPQTTDTGLQASLGLRINSNGGVANVTLNNTSPEYTFRRLTRIFTETQVTGSLTELGFWTAGTGGTLTNRSLFKDSAGNPTTVFKTSSDILRVQYEYRLYAPLFDVTDTINIGTGSITYTIRPQRVQDLAGWSTLLDDFGDWSAFARVHDSDTLQPRTAQNNATPSEDASASLAPYSNGSFFRDCTITVSPTVGNFTSGFGLFTYTMFRENVNSPYFWQLSLSPRIIKNTDQLFQITLRQSWSRL